MEYALEVTPGRDKAYRIAVLILVLMEYALEAVCDQRDVLSDIIRLNPCSNGICSRRSEVLLHYWQSRCCLNPCSNGICSRRNTQEAFMVMLDRS